MAIDNDSLEQFLYRLRLEPNDVPDYRDSYLLLEEMTSNHFLRIFGYDPSDIATGYISDIMFSGPPGELRIDAVRRLLLVYFKGNNRLCERFNTLYRPRSRQAASVPVQHSEPEPEGTCEVCAICLDEINMEVDSTKCSHCPKCSIPNASNLFVMGVLRLVGALIVGNRGIHGVTVKLHDLDL